MKLKNKKIPIFHDGKLARGIKADFVRSEGKRILISYYYDDEWRTEWFVKRRRYEGGVYESVEHNFWFYKDCTTERFKAEMKECLAEPYFNKLFRD